MYPQSIPEFRAHLLAYQPPYEISAAIWAAQGVPSPVVQAVEVFSLLSPVADLDQEGLALLLGAAHLIASNGWHGKGGEAATVLAQRARDYVTSPAAQP